MTPEQLRKRTKQFALATLRFCRQLPRSEEARVIGRQLLRAGTAVGANYRSVCRARSDAEFISRLGVVIDEADESAYWLELLVDGAIVAVSATCALTREADELTRIFVASRETTRARVRAQRAQREKDKAQAKS
jgi:four helix bundle protein